MPLQGRTQNIYEEWAPYNIQVNVIVLGYFATEQTQIIRVDVHNFSEFIVNRTPAVVWDDPKDMQGAVVFLSAKASDFING